MARRSREGVALQRGAAQEDEEQPGTQDQANDQEESQEMMVQERVLTRGRVEKLAGEAGVRELATAKSLRLEDLGADRVAPKALQSFTGLFKLLLQKNKLTSLPKRVFAPGSASTLTFLDLSQNRLDNECLERLGRWPLDKLVTLKLAGNRLTRFTSAPFARMTKLAALVLNDNELETIDFSEQALPALNTLIVSDNQISSLGSEVGLKNLSGLKKISASRNKLTAVPDVRECPLLAELRLSNNSISRIDASALEPCTKLAVLDLSSNEISKTKALQALKTVAATLIQISLIKNPVVDKLIKAPRKDGDAPAEEKVQLARAVVERYFKDAPRLKTCDGISLQKAGIAAPSAAATKTSSTLADRGNPQKGGKNEARRSEKGKTPESASTKSGFVAEARETEDVSKSSARTAAVVDSASDRAIVADASVEADVGARSGVAAVIVEAPGRRKREAATNEDNDTKSSKRSKKKKMANEDDDGIDLKRPSTKTWAVKRKVDAW
ncbi:Leucine-rich repeat-containing protein 40 [Hondaea fermentalgiana]|uniref:Leucine-rich repeat-containing protein 40 n=1 Tax=Hondaea fermentalgiana TaxID=2315210 RepID=A0A2R5G5M7_9STRA|nr:Leucine-rich repeat-containing protein 40 [Hondaea fermentalgiana]|eukprot:GBG25078.1 Leucine-rich repeat-containing protein 40 [Hondaea fermentalgiana]